MPTLVLSLDNAAEQVELPVPAEITALVRDGKKIAAIRDYRRAFEASLTDATRAVGRLQR